MLFLTVTLYQCCSHNLHSHMLLWGEESLFLPPLVPAGLHILWAVGGWERQAGVWQRYREILNWSTERDNSWRWTPMYTFWSKVQISMKREEIIRYLSFLREGLKQCILSSLSRSISVPDLQHSVKEMNT